MSKAETANIWNRIAPDFDQVGPPFFSYFGRRLVQLVQIPDGAKVLDVATGRGAILFPAAQQVGKHGQIIGTDLSMGMVRQTATETQQANLKQVSLLQMDAQHLAFATASFDFLLCGHAIFFFPSAVNQFYRALKPGGQIGLTILAKGFLDWFWELFRTYASLSDNDKNDKQDDLAVDTPAGLKALLSGAGFENVAVIEEVTDFIYANEEEWWSTLWTLGVRDQMEKMKPATLENFKTDISQKLQPFKQSDGIHLLFRCLFASGSKSNTRHLNE
ncbi:MAG: class I SAM-dependent methyltransferase [Chloroflexi bacterium]|nr:class I SAM-dependent methyltransferase [Chloroflexota bacterium]